MASSGMKLTYFDVRGLGELARLQFAFAGKTFEDNRINRDNWSSMKDSTMPFNQMPLLEVDGEVYPQSRAIWLYLAREFGLYPKEHKEQLIVDIVLETLGDCAKLMVKWAYMADGPEKEALKNDCPNQTEKFLVYLDSLIAKNQSGFFVGESLTLADLAMFDALTGYLRHSFTFSEDKYPNIAKNRDNVLKNANLAEYVEKRPDLPM